MPAKKKKSVVSQDPRPFFLEESVSLDRLHPDPANARKHGNRNMSTIVASLKEHGQVEPLVVQRSSGRIIGGNGRYEAMRLLGWSTCSVAWVDIGDLQATKLGISLNRSAELAEWDNGTLERLLFELRDSGADLETMGFDDEEMRRMFDVGLDLAAAAAPMANAQAAAEEQPPPPPPGDGVSHVRLVQLFFDESQYDEFVSVTDRLAEHLGTENLTDTVFVAVRDFYNQEVMGAK